MQLLRQAGCAKVTEWNLLMVPKQSHHIHKN
jgi:hypothetical protein